jgi:phosphate transport system substrate-binding protein
VQWPVGIGGKGNEGVAAYVKQIKGSIGYVEFSYALQNRLTFSRMKNAAGNFVQPRDETFSAAAASADWANARDFYLVMTNAPGEQAWPITATNFILMRKQPKTAEGAKAALDYFRWIYANGDAQARQLDYVPLPDSLVRQIETYWQQNARY